MPLPLTPVPLRATSTVDSSLSSDTMLSLPDLAPVLDGSNETPTLRVLPCVSVVSPLSVPMANWPHRHPSG